MAEMGPTKALRIYEGSVSWVGQSWPDLLLRCHQSFFIGFGVSSVFVGWANVFGLAVSPSVRILRR